MEDESNRLRREPRARPPSQKPPSKTRTLSIPIPPVSSESPMIAKNKRLREDAMSAYRAQSQEPAPAESSERGRQATADGKGHRRSSSINGRRGKRISQSFEATGILCASPSSLLSQLSSFLYDSTSPQLNLRIQLFQTYRFRYSRH